MAVAVDADHVNAGKKRLDLPDDFFRDCREPGGQLRGHEIAGQNKVELGPGRAVRGHGDAGFRLAPRSHHMGAAEQAPQFQPLLLLIFIVAAPPFFGKHGKVHVPLAAQSSPVPQGQGRDNRDLLGGQLQQEIMLLLQCRR